jgi:hypothetical protein
MRGADIGVDDHELPPVEAYAEEQAGSRQRGQRPRSIRGLKRKCCAPGALKWDVAGRQGTPRRVSG